MNTAGRALAIIMIVSCSQDLRAMQALLDSQRQLEQSGGVTFDTDNIKSICKKALRNGMHVPFEVVGSRSIFAMVLNRAQQADAAACDGNGQVVLTEADLSSLLSMNHTVIPSNTQSKLATLISIAYIQSCQRIKQNGIEEEVAWRQQYYKWNRKVKINHLDMSGKIPHHTHIAISDYVDNLNLEDPFELSDLQNNYEKEA